MERHARQLNLRADDLFIALIGASKAAIRSFVRTWTTDLKDRRIRSNVLSPGPINTPLELAVRRQLDFISHTI
jgi:NAD(P)-dependent dehydrogenase (short-subunit alcohol dehydrogenase family)